MRENVILKIISFSIYKKVHLLYFRTIRLISQRCKFDNNINADNPLQDHISPPPSTLAIQSLLQVVVTQIICVLVLVENSTPITKWNAITVITIDSTVLIVLTVSAAGCDSSKTQIGDAFFLNNFKFIKFFCCYAQY